MVQMVYLRLAWRAKLFIFWMRQRSQVPGPRRPGPSQQDTAFLIQRRDYTFSVAEPHGAFMKYTRGTSELATALIETEAPGVKSL